MKSFKLLCLISVLLSAPLLHADESKAPESNASESRLTGPAALTFYLSLDIKEVEVREEHGGPAYAYAKYGEQVGCQINLERTTAECWTR